MILTLVHIVEDRDHVGAQAARTPTLSDLAVARVLVPKGPYKGQCFASILLDGHYCTKLIFKGYDVDKELCPLHQFVRANMTLKGKPELVQQAFGSVLYMEASLQVTVCYSEGWAMRGLVIGVPFLCRLDVCEQAPNGICHPAQLIGGVHAEEWQAAQRSGFSNRLIRRFGKHYAVLSFAKPGSAPKQVVQWSSGRTLDRFIPHHTWESDWVYIENVHVELAGTVRPFADALMRWHNPPQLSTDSLTKWVSRWQLCMSSTLSAGEATVVEINDVLSMNTRVALTDGCGYISCGQAESIAAHLRAQLGPGTEIGTISAVQIRIGGAKGMLCVDKHLDNADMTIYVRRSMLKIVDNCSSILEVLDFVDGRQIQPYAKLNNEVLPLLEDAALRAGAQRNHLEKRVFNIQQKNFLQAIADTVGAGSADENAEVMGDRLRSLSLTCSALRAPTEHCAVARYIRELETERVSENDWAAKEAPSANDPAELLAVADTLEECAKNYTQKPQYSLGAGSGYLYIVPDLSRTLKAGECRIRHNGKDILGEVNLWRNPCYLPSDIVKWTAVLNPMVDERMQVDNLIVLPCRTEMDRAPADQMSGGDYDGDKAAFLKLRGRAFCPAEQGSPTIPPKKENKLDKCHTTDVHEVLQVGYDLDDACAELFSKHEQGIKGRLTIPYFNAVTWRGATDALTIQTAWYALRAMDCIKQNESTKDLLKSMRLSTRGQDLKAPLWKGASTLSHLGVKVERGAVIEVEPPGELEQLQLLTKLRARAEALHWLCQGGRILDVAKGCQQYAFLIQKAGEHFFTTH